MHVLNDGRDSPFEKHPWSLGAGRQHVDEGVELAENIRADRSGDWRRYVALPSLISPDYVRGLIADWLVARFGMNGGQHDGGP
ncbi:hypothetical protein BH11GEM1_BH11GEM1_03500 [soil metagenome]